jgi:long-chain acyl-CoA synthetase
MEWLYFDMATQGCQGIGSGIYPTDSPDQLRYVCQHADVRILVVENEEQLDKWLEVRGDLPNITKVIVLDNKGLKSFDDPDVMFIDEFEKLGRDSLGQNGPEFDQRIDQGTPEDTAILVYTSGTTGPPKGAMISHRNVMWQAKTMRALYNIGPEDESVSYLPLCHVAERLLSVFLPIAAGSTVNMIEAQDTSFENIMEVSPTFFMGVPRIWEKMYSSIILKMKDATWLGKKAFDLALTTGRKVAEAEDANRPVPVTTRAANWLAHRLVFDNLNVMLGLDRTHICFSAAAPISPEMINWFRYLGVSLYECYGQTESTGLVTSNLPGANKSGTIGRAFPGLDVKIAEDGEILVRGPAVFKGYLNQPDKTAETIVGGWLLTGDVGRVDDDGFYRITDRKKDIIITAGGKNITPSEIENEIKFSPYVSDAVVIGDRRKFLTCLVMIDHENVAQFAQDLNVPFSDFKSLCHASEVQDLIRQEIEQANTKFARVETIKDFRLIDQQLTAEDDELTATMKLKRSFVEKKYAELINGMYGRG